MASTTERRATQPKKSRGTGMQIGTGRQPQGEEYYFGTPEEVENRVATGYGDKDPGDHPPHFVQIPGEFTGKNMNNPSLGNRSGAMKFSKGPQ